MTTSVSDLHKIRIQSGKHAMLSRLCSLSLTAKRNIDLQADKIVLRSDPLYNTASFIQHYTQHILSPHIDSDSDHKRFFLKVSFINKGIDFIDLQSIFRSINVQNTIPGYFRNTEPPIICYKYNKPVRNIIFNYNKIVSDLNIDTNCNGPASCDCNKSKFCYKPSGHIITGDFNIIKDKRLKSLLSKGPKYRLPSLIDFDSCRNIIIEALKDFSVKWCRREHADTKALTAWINSIIKIMDTRIEFYKNNNHLLPRKPRLSYRYLKNCIQDFHSKFVFVPADKAANNVIIV